MTLKELRISKGLNQKECAEFLEMTTRNYQNYENNKDKVMTSKYNSIYQKLESYRSPKDIFSIDDIQFNTNVSINDKLQALTKNVINYKKRDCFTLLEKFMTHDIAGKVLILYGLRRTGKTTLLFQMISKLPAQKTAYIKIKTTDNMSMLTKDLDLLYKMGYKYIFIDEITLMDDFINTASLLSDIYSLMGMKIALSGTDFLGFLMASYNELYDRATMIHTSFIPFKEYSHLLDINSIDTYIEYGGTLKIENMSFDDPEFSFEEVSFRDDESTRKYIDTSISHNIEHSLNNDHYGEYFNELRELHDNGELTNVINRIVENINHRFLLNVVEKEFKSHDLGSAKELLLHDYSSNAQHVLYDVDEKQILERLKRIIDIREKNEKTISLTNSHIEKIKKYLFMLDLLVKCAERYESKGENEVIIFSQPGMRYSITKALIYSLMQDEYFITLSNDIKEYITAKILEDVKGRMLEDIVLLETTKAKKKNQEVFKFKFDISGEYDMVIYDKENNCCKIYEIKHSDKINHNQIRYLIDEEKNAIVSQRFGPIIGKYVLYSGDTKNIENIEYLNVEEYLKNL